MNELQKEWLTFLREENLQHTDKKLKKYLGVDRDGYYKLNILGSILYILDQHDLGLAAWGEFEGFGLRDATLWDSTINRTRNGPPSQTRLIHSYDLFNLRTSTGIGKDNNRFQFKGYLYKSLLGMDLGITVDPPNDGKQTNTWQEIADYVEENPSTFFTQYD